MYNIHAAAVNREHRKTRPTTDSELCDTKIQASALAAPTTIQIAGYPDITVKIGTTMHVAAKNHAHIGAIFQAMAVVGSTGGSMAGPSFE